MLENLNPTLHAPIKPRLNRLSLNFDNFEWNGQREPINQAEIFDHIRDIRDPEHPHSLEVLGVVNDEWIYVDDNEGWYGYINWVSYQSELIRSLPRRFKIEVKVKPGTHDTEDEINKQLADKERVAAALENPSLLKLVNDCLVIQND
ncbi:unnamed protein product [Heterobilharzia americana]|nr:unnamed protein product [Heterobilharzia americana]